MVLNFTFQNWSQSCQSEREYCIRTIAVHEFGHALGIAHEQNRPDRPESCTEPTQGPNGDNLIGPWDLSSVMNYCNPNWNGDGGLSATDMQGIVVAYGVSGFAVRIPPSHDTLKGDFTNIITGDFNADGRTDLLRQEKNSWDDDAVSTADVWLSQGNGQFSLSGDSNHYTVLPGDLTELVPGDFSGDGRIDLLRREKGALDDDNIRTSEVWLSTW